MSGTFPSRRSARLVGWATWDTPTTVRVDWGTVALLGLAALLALMLVVAALAPVGTLREDAPAPYNPNGVSLPEQPNCKVPR